jgi:hypothetical protein
MRKSKLTDKDMDLMREQDSAKEQVHQTHGVLRDYSHQNRVELDWNMNEDCKKDRIFILRFNGQEAYLDAEQMQRYLRWV